MLFNSYEFVFLFLPLALAISLPLRGKALLRALTLLSFLFYAFAGHAWFLLPMLFTTAVDYSLAKPMAQRQGLARKALLWLSLSLNLGLLGYFKYSHLLFGLNPGLVLPAGISFYTFQTMAYMIDVYRGQARPEPSFWRFAAFVSFFPHLVAGPLTRHHQLIPALHKIEDEGIRPRWEAALYLFSCGLAKKVLIGDALAALVDPILGPGGPANGLLAWIALLGYSLQIYFDFSGYSDMALGLGWAFGVGLPRNFDSPYLSPDPRQFWRRWHMTLSAWLRDYLYIGLGGNRQGPLRRDLNMLLTMFLGGLWHGAHWTFAVWGLYHGCLLVAHRIGAVWWDALPKALRIGGTFLLVSLGWVFFRAPDFGAARFWFGSLFGRQGLGLAWLGLHHSEFLHQGAWLALGLGLAFAAPEPVTRLEKGTPRRWEWALLGLLTALALSQITLSSRFLYFQF